MCYKGKVVAVVDPNVVTRTLLQLKLSSTGHRVIAYESEADFLESSATWDLIVVTTCPPFKRMTELLSVLLGRLFSSRDEHNADTRASDVRPAL